MGNALGNRVTGLARQAKVYDVVGVGFGPSNLALGVALEDAASELANRGLDWLFLERKTEHAWHPGMLLEGAQMQISFLKDLATLRDPQSRFTFLNYLKSQGRLHEFVNLREFYPTRIEYNDYFRWAAKQLENRVRYGQEVLSVLPLPGDDGGTVDLLKVSARSTNGRTEEYLARNLVLATGGQSSIPEGVELSENGRVFHSQEFLERMGRDYPSTDSPYEFLVVGAGQSAAEIFHYLISSYPNARVTATIRGFAYRPSDDSEFANEIFSPKMVDLLWGAPRRKRAEILEAYRNTNYSVVDADLIRALYKLLYSEKVAGRERVRIEPFMELKAVRETAAKAIARFHNTLLDVPLERSADAVILATGYANKPRLPLLDNISPHLVPDETGGYVVERDYRISSKPGFRPAVFVQGLNENTHGISDTLLSILPDRAHRLLQTILETCNS
jgi:L-ornithine N5-oxygenase